MTDPTNTSDFQNNNIVQSNYCGAVGYQTKIENGSIYQSNLIENKLSELVARNLQVDPTASVEVLVERLKSDDRLIQINAGNALAFQTLIQEGGTANVGVHLHGFDKDKLDEVLKAFWKSLQPAEIPNNVPNGVAKFIGREPELERLHTQLQQGNLVSISAVEGMGGVGKTELAIQYTRQQASFYEGGICWLSAREFDLGTQIVSFAQSQLNLKVPEGLELSDQVAFCWRNWRAGDVLLVLDDVVNYSRDVEPYLPPAAFTRFKLVMTTRQKFGPPIQSLSLDVLSPEQSLELLTVLIGEERVQRELDIAKTLCNWLEHLPLGIELVGRYLLESTKRSLTLTTLLFQLQEKANLRQALTHDALKQDEEMTGRRGAEAAFELSWGELDDNSRHLGKLLSLFAAAPIPWRLAEGVERKYCEDSDAGNTFEVAGLFHSRNLAPESSELEQATSGGEESPILRLGESHESETALFEVDKIKAARTQLIKLHLLQISQEENIYYLHPLIREFFRSELEKSSLAMALKSAFCKELIRETQQIPRVVTKQIVEKIHLSKIC
jgi:hypothetical protein